jgi:hypothetical protein
MDKRKHILLERQKGKTSEGEFIYELLNSFELSPKVSEEILTPLLVLSPTKKRIFSIMKNEMIFL